MTHLANYNKFEVTNWFLKELNKFIILTSQLSCKIDSILLLFWITLSLFKKNFGRGYLWHCFWFCVSAFCIIKRAKFGCNSFLHNHNHSWTVSDLAGSHRIYSFSVYQQTKSFIIFINCEPIINWFSKGRGGHWVQMFLSSHKNLGQCHSEILIFN